MIWWHFSVRNILTQSAGIPISKLVSQYLLCTLEQMLGQCTLINVQRDATICSLYFFYCKITLYVSGAVQTHHQEYIKL